MSVSTRTPRLRLRLAGAGSILVAAAMPFVISAQGDPPVIGSDAIVRADPPVPRPDTQPCTVELLDEDLGSDPDDYLDSYFTYQPPEACPGPWAKVVLEGEFRPADNPSGGETGELVDTNISLKGVRLYQGAGRNFSGAWHIERDITDYAAILATPGDEEGLWRANAYSRYGTDGPYPLHATVRMKFYPASASAPAHEVPSQVHRVDGYDRQIVFPRNSERVFADIWFRSHQRPGNETTYWYSCVPTDLAQTFPELLSPAALGDNPPYLDDPSNRPQGCAGGSYREVLVRIDGEPAGLAPVLPLLTPGAKPIPSVQWMSHVPYRVDLSPFAGKLSDGQPHRVTVTVRGQDAGDPIGGLGTLLVYVDPGAAQVTGSVVRNTLAEQLSAVPGVTNTLVRDPDGSVSGEIHTGMERSYAIAGTVNGSRGRVRNVAAHTIRYSNDMSLRSVGHAGENPSYSQDIVLRETSSRVSRQYVDAALVREEREVNSYPLDHDYSSSWAEPSPRTWNSIQRHRQTRELRDGNGATLYAAQLLNSVASAASGDRNGDTSSEGQTYAFSDSDGSCYRASLVGNDGLLTAYRTGAGCADNTNVLTWHALPDGAPTAFGWLSASGPAAR